MRTTAVFSLALLLLVPTAAAEPTNPAETADYAFDVIDIAGVGVMASAEVIVFGVSAPVVFGTAAMATDIVADAQAAFAESQGVVQPVTLCVLNFLPPSPDVLTPISCLETSLGEVSANATASQPVLTSYASASASRAAAHAEAIDRAAAEAANSFAGIWSEAAGNVILRSEEFVESA